MGVISRIHQTHHPNTFFMCGRGKWCSLVLWGELCPDAMQHDSMDDGLVSSEEGRSSRSKVVGFVWCQEIACRSNFHQEGTNGFSLQGLRGYIYIIYSIFVGRIKTLEFVFGRFWGSKGIEVEKTTSMILPKTKKRNPKGKVISQAAILSKAGWKSFRKGSRFRRILYFI